MSFISTSSQYVIDNTTSVSNLFLNDYLPTCGGDCARVYLYGLYLCNHGRNDDNTLEHMASVLNLDTEDIISAFEYWQTEGLVQVLEIEPIQIKYLPVKSGKIRKFNTEKYAEFNAYIESILRDRMISPIEFTEYYEFLEHHKMEPMALVMIAKYCADFKGANVGYKYILHIARNYARNGFKTVETIAKQLEDETNNLSDVTKVIKALGLKRSSEPEDFELYTKWTDKMGFAADVILSVAKNVKGSVNKLDAFLTKCFELKLFETHEIKNYQEKKSQLFELAKNINKKIGVYYENLENIIETYIVNWQLRGFDDDTLLEIASFCFKSGIRTLEGMDATISRFYKQGITNTLAINEYIAGRIELDKQVSVVLEKLGISRKPNQVDRDFYHTWVIDWNTPAELVEHATTISKGSMQYMNRVLSNWFNQGVKTVDTAKNTSIPAEKTFIRHSYSAINEEKFEQTEKDAEQKLEYFSALTNPEYMAADKLVRELTIGVAKGTATQKELDKAVKNRDSLNA